MVRHNNIIPNTNKQKWWQRYVRTWFNQAGRKKSRRLARQKKAAAIFPRPAAGNLRPIVHPPTQRYNLKLRLGKGFTLAELREAGISPKKARTIGIAVDHRRKNRCTESLQANVQRLKLYKSKLMVFPRKTKAKAGDTARSELQNASQNTHKQIIPVPKPQLREKARAITAAEKEFSAYKVLRVARRNKHKEGKRLKKIMEKENAQKEN